MGSHSIKTNDQIVPIKKDAYTFTISYSSHNTGFYGYTKNGSRIDFIYTLKSVNPHYKDLSKKYAKESGQEFFRISLDGKINLFGDDYEQVSLADIESQLLFIMRSIVVLLNHGIYIIKVSSVKQIVNLTIVKRSVSLKLRL